MPAHRITGATVNGLFGYGHQSVSINPGQPCIITGPNGSGKTHLLRLIHAALRLDVPRLNALPFRDFTVTFDDDTSLKTTRDSDSDSNHTLTFELFRGSRRVGSRTQVNLDDLDPRQARVDIQQLPDGRYVDMRNGRPLTRSQAEGFFTGDRLTARIFRKDRHILHAVAGMHPVLIDTKRLEAPTFERAPGDRQLGRASTRPISQVEQYVDEIRTRILSAQRASVMNQGTDISFATRALDAAKATVRIPELRQKYDSISKQYADLARNGLTAGGMPLDFPTGAMNPTAKRILNVLVDDLAQRLKPLAPLNDRVNLLRRILDNKLIGKKTFIAESGGFGFQSATGEEIAVETLSSGEQHLIALFALLLFSSRDDSIVLIDEPEISMHAAWKHDFLEDIAEVARLGNLQVILATHSTSIINGQWSMTRDLTPLIPAPGQDLVVEDHLDLDLDND